MHGANLEQKEEAETREAIFAPYQVNSKMMASAGAQCRLLHCLPAERGREVTDDVMEDESRYGIRPCGVVSERSRAASPLLEYRIVHLNVHH